MHDYIWNNILFRLNEYQGIVFRNHKMSDSSLSQSSAPRRHSLSLAMQNLRLSSGSGRRSSITSKMSVLTRSMSLKLSQSSRLHSGINLDNALLENALGRHYNEQAIQVGRFINPDNSHNFTRLKKSG